MYFETSQEDPYFFITWETNKYEMYILILSIVHFISGDLFKGRTIPTDYPHVSSIPNVFHNHDFIICLVHIKLIQNF